MRMIKVKKNQTIFDIAIENYGTCEAVGEILDNNADLRNDPHALAALGIDALKDKSFYIDVAVMPESAVIVDENSPYMNTAVLKQLSGAEIATFNL